MSALCMQSRRSYTRKLYRATDFKQKLTILAFLLNSFIKLTSMAHNKWQLSQSLVKGATIQPLTSKLCTVYACQLRDSCLTCKCTCKCESGQCGCWSNPPLYIILLTHTRSHHTMWHLTFTFDQEVNPVKTPDSAMTAFDFLV